jgi:shikimate dehydrogenase
LDSKTLFTGVFGFPVGHSMSPLMHNTAFAALELNYTYGAFEVEKGALKKAVEGIRALGFRGVNVTIPHKVEVMDYLDEIDEEARQIGAVNTIVNENGTLIGYNTDGQGYVRSLTEEWNTPLKGKKVVILGAGGAARGVAVSLAKSGVAEIIVANRSFDKAHELATHLSQWVGSRGVALEHLDQTKPLDADLLINTTSVGMSPHVAHIPISPAVLHDQLMVSDLIYNPLYTELLTQAQQAGARVHNGLGMFIHQGALAFERWTGQAAPVSLMKEAVLQFLQKS